MQTFNSFNDILLTVQTSGKCVSTNRDFTEVADDFRLVWRERHDAFVLFQNDFLDQMLLQINYTTVPRRW